jgi:putative ABC transport system permease protein
MQLRIVLLQLWRDLKAQRLRSGLTLFGLAWGTFCVVVLLAFGKGLQEFQYQQQAALGENMLLLWTARTSLPFEGLPRGRYIQLEDADADAIARDVSRVTAISPEYSGNTSAKGPKGESGVIISGVRPCYGDMRNIEPEPGGRFLSARDEAERRRVCVIGFQVKEDTFGDQPALGQALLMDGIPFIVIGTVAKKQQDSNYNGPDDGHVFIPSSTAVASLGLRKPDNLVIGLAGRAKGKEVIPEIRSVLARHHRFDPADEEALMVWDVGEMLVMFQNIFVGFRAFLSILGSFTLAVAAIGVANTMSMVVEDRTPHIGISMALGARRRWILGQVLMETVCFTVTGGALGVAFASLVVWAAGFLPFKEYIGTPQISSFTALFTAGMLGICGILAGIGPARRAAALSPAEALRT